MTLIQNVANEAIYCVSETMGEVMQILDESTEWLVSTSEDDTLRSQPLTDVLKGDGWPRAILPLGPFRHPVDVCRLARIIVDEAVAMGLTAKTHVDLRRNRILVHISSQHMFVFRSETVYDLGDRFACSVIVSI